MSGSFSVRNPEIEQLLRRLADRLTLALPPEGWGFTLLLYETHEEGSPPRDGSMFYISSPGDRHEKLAMIEAWIKRQRQ